MHKISTGTLTIVTLVNVGKKNYPYLQFSGILSGLFYKVFLTHGLRSKLHDRLVETIRIDWLTKFTLLFTGLFFSSLVLASNLNL